MPSSSSTIEPECRRCGLKEARGEEMVFDDGSVDWKCDACGRTMRLGYLENSRREQRKNKDDRIRAEANRDRYRGELFSSTEKRFWSTRKEKIGGEPDLMESFLRISNPRFKQEEYDADEKEDLKPFDYQRYS